MTTFALLAALLLGLVLVVLVPPLWRRPRSTAADERKAANLAIFRDQLAELEREKADGTLADADFAPARAELQKRLLEDVGNTASAAEARAVAARPTAFALLLLLPALALAAYVLLGNPRAIDAAARAPAEAPMTPERIQAMVEKLAERQKANPDDMDGWLMLARSYRALGRYDEAIAAYAKAEKVINDDPDLLSAYAETIAIAKGAGFKGKPRQLVARALKLNAEHPHSLFLAGAAAMEAGENQQGIAYWEKLLPMVEPDSEIDRVLRQGIETMKSRR